MAQWLKRSPQHFLMQVKLSFVGSNRTLDNTLCVPLIFVLNQSVFGPISSSPVGSPRDGKILRPKVVLWY